MGLPNRTIVFVLGALLLFLLINFNPDLGVAYSLIFILTIVLVMLDPKISIDLDLSRSNLLRDIGVGAVGYAAFLGIAFVAVTLLQTTAQLLGLESIISLMAEAQPVFAGNVILSIVTFGLLIPIIENLFFFGVGLEFLSDKTGIPIVLNKIEAHGLYGLIAFGFMLFHLTAKGIPSSIGQVSNDPALLVTFIFGYVMCVLVALAKTQEGRNNIRPSIFTHQIANVLAIVRKLTLV